jgi:outer membrane biosynthesis protein TonB
MNNTRENLTGSFITSALLHAGGMFFLVFGMPSLSKAPPPLPWKPVPIDIVEIGAITNTRLRSQTKPTQKTAPPKQEAKQESKPEPKPAPLPPVKKPEETKKVESTPTKDEVLLPSKEKPKKKPEPKPQPEPTPKKESASEQDVDPLASVLKNLADIKKEAPPIPDAKIDKTFNNGDSAEGEGKGFGPALSDRLTISQEDALRRQIGSCWNMPVGARYAEDLIVEVLIEVNEDRTVRSAQVVDQLRYASDPYFRAAAEAALRALRHPRCTPLELPEDQYEQWKTIRFNFDPRDMI